MSKRVLFTTAAWLAAAAIASGQETFWLRYRTSREPYRHLKCYRSHRVDATAEPPGGARLPKLVSERPCFARWETPMSPSGHVRLAFDASSRNGPHDRLYVDADCDGHLDDERFVKAYRVRTSSGREYTYFSEARVLFPGDDGPVTYHLNVTFRVLDDRSYLYLTAAGWYEGAVEVGGKPYTCKLIDYNVNGTFDDTSMDFAQIDRIQIDGDDIADPRHVGRYVRIGGKLYHPRIVRDGACVGFLPAGDVPMGTIRVPEAITALSVGGRNGSFSPKPAGGRAKLPAGPYRLHTWDIERKDDSGTRWRAQAYRFDGNSLFELRAGEAKELAIGEPLVASLEHNRSSRRHYFNRTLKGRLGAQVRIYRDGRQPPAPRLRIRNKDGSYERAYRLEYG